MNYDEKADAAAREMFHGAGVEPSPATRAIMTRYLYLYGRQCAAEALDEHAKHLKQIAVVTESDGSISSMFKVKGLDYAVSSLERQAAALRPQPSQEKR